MKNIGKYRGVDCFECSNSEWQTVGKNFPEVIFIINGVMVKNGVIIGHYDGKTVKDNWDGIKYSTRVLSDYQTEVAIGRAREKLKETKKVPEFFEDEKKETKAKAYEPVNYATFGGKPEETFENFDGKIDWAVYSSVVDEFFATLKDPDGWKV